MSSIDKDGNEIPDGFRPRRKRKKSDMDRLIKEGWVLAPGTEREPEQHKPDAVILTMEVARLEGSGAKE